MRPRKVCARLQRRLDPAASLGVRFARGRVRPLGRRLQLVEARLLGGYGRLKGGDARLKRGDGGLQGADLARGGIQLLLRIGGGLRYQLLQIVDIALQAAGAPVHATLVRAQLDARHVLRARDAAREQKHASQTPDADHDLLRLALFAPADRPSRSSMPEPPRRHHGETAAERTRGRCRACIIPRFRRGAAARQAARIWDRKRSIWPRRLAPCRASSAAWSRTISDDCPVFPAAPASASTFWLTRLVLSAAWFTLWAMSRVVASCSSTAAETALAISLIRAIVAPIRSMAWTASSVVLWIVPIWLEISSVAFAVWAASDFTSLATAAESATWRPISLMETLSSSAAAATLCTLVEACLEASAAKPASVLALLATSTMPSAVPCTFWAEAVTVSTTVLTSLSSPSASECSSLRRSCVMRVRSWAARSSPSSASRRALRRIFKAEAMSAISSVPVVTISASRSPSAMRCMLCCRRVTRRTTPRPT